MEALHAAREAAPERTTITKLVARAIEDRYANKVVEMPTTTGTDDWKEAA
jgi:hypothetical protein